MPRLIDVPERKQCAELMTDTALLAVWYGHHDEAEAMLKWLRHRCDDSPEVLYLEAFRLMSAGKAPEAERLLRQGLKTHAGDLGLQLLLASLLAKAGRREGETVLAAVTQRAGELNEEGRALLDEIRKDCVPVVRPFRDSRAALFG